MTAKRRREFIQPRRVFFLIRAIPMVIASFDPGVYEVVETFGP
jgi:hypothetical protein